MRRAVATLAVLTVLLAGCGGDSDDEAASTTTSTAPATSVSVDTNFTGEGSERFCELARTYLDRTDQLTVSDPNQLRTAVAEAEGTIQETVAAAPAEIKGDVQVVAAAFATLVQVLTQANYDFTKVSPEAHSGLQKPEVQASTQRLSAYTQKVCGITTTTVP